ncbi:MAG TPA: hypothetical protein VK177_01320 [Flavobacteriales bacterium]|nr:hypothetical protein [Flavobacteriales bacterium]
MDIAEVNLTTFVEQLQEVRKLTTQAGDDNILLLLEYILPGKKLKLRIGEGENRALVSVYYKYDLYNFQPERPVKLTTMRHMLKTIYQDLQAPEREIKAAWIKHKGKVCFYEEESTH